MHGIVYLMDFFISGFQYLGHLPRRFPAAVSVDSLGYVAHKRDWVRNRFQSYNFSFILSGGGEYWREGVRWTVQAPCVITQAPGLMMEYGPSGEWTEWEELFLIYNANRVPDLERMGLIRRDVPAWSIKDAGLVRAWLRELAHADEGGRTAGLADRVDRLCELLVLESILGEVPAPVDAETRAIQAIRDGVRANIAARHDFHELARQQGFSAATFRRRWQAVVGVPPGRYVLRLKIREACRLLAETRLKVGEIADRLGFEDRLYFSRRFRMEVGMGAMDYRRRHRSPLTFMAPT